MIALLLAFVVGVLFTLTLAVLLASGLVSRALESFTLADDEMGLVDEFAHLR